MRGGLSCSARGSPDSRPARDLESAGATVTVVEARDRVGGRVHTISSGLGNRQHAEAGADLIEEDAAIRPEART